MSDEPQTPTPTTTEERRVSRRKIIAGGAAGAAAVGLGVKLATRGGGIDIQEGTGLVKAARSSGALPVDDPESGEWGAAEKAHLAFGPQQMVPPNLHEATIEYITVRALYDGSTVALLVEWKDAAANDLEAVTRFRDAVAVMFPLNTRGQEGAEAPSITMGATGAPTYILHWKASWQRDVDDGFQGVEASYPLWFNDVYPGAEVLVGQGMSKEDARTFYPGLKARNPLSRQRRTSPVEELHAEGFGTLTSLPEQRAKGRGVRDGDGWKVALAPAPEAGLSFGSGATVPVAFAAWDGEHQQVGARKHFVGWCNLQLPSRYE